ncbi:peptidyl-prolyl cis-trans isomerase [Novosphingobium piscinae]|uniref:Parvulin-like PPIase n=1 Tax=Novosphingobium piscinae TaxID=1507448 RepID=A0A7X1KQD3_9SPHN|nr:SurA N-terminal domain-containing protein [Novosphingobium piscinae]MBC2669644.1 SurA N-terminal domain-containing protein [Novosphingobium piscinae]
MLHFFRSFMHSKIGVVFALIFLALIALAFAAGDVAGMRNAVTGNDGRVATVGGRGVDASELAQAATSAVEQLKRDNPRLMMKAFVAGGGLGTVLDQTIDRAAIAEFGERHGVIASDRLVDSEIAKIPAFQGPDGKFSDAAFRALLAQRGLTEATVRRELADGLIARQLLTPAALGARMPGGLVLRYAALFAERRTGTIALLPAAAFAPPAAPAEAEVTAYYNANRARYARPERRTVRFAVFDETALKSVPAPTEAEIAARYTANKAAYAPSEDRRVSQLILPTEAAAKAVLAELAGGRTLEAAASAKGLAVAKLGPLNRAALANQANDAVASAAFGTTAGKTAGPVRGPLGWVVLRVDAIDAKPGKSLDQARPEILAELSLQKRRAALTDFSAKVEDEFDNGASLGDVAKELALTITETPALTADGQVFGTAGQKAPAELARVLATAFAMEREGQPQLAEIEPGKTFIVFDVSRITPSAPAPLAEIKPQVMTDLLLQKGAAAAKAAAEKVLGQVKQGQELGAAVAALGVPRVPPVDRIELGREDLARQGQQVPPALALLFSMAKGTTKVLAAPGNQGWFVVSLAQIVPGDPARVAPMLPAAARELSGLTGREYAAQLRAAIRQEVGVKRNQAAIDAVARRLVGTN